jgi:hypothetical protein
MRPVPQLVVLDCLRSLVAFSLNKSLLYEVVSNFITQKLLDFPNLPGQQNYFEMDVVRKGEVTISDISDALVGASI